MTWKVKGFNGPAVIAGVTPTLDYRFGNDRSETEAVSLTDKLTFSRSSTSTYTNFSNFVVNAAIDEPRFDYSPNKSGLLIESASTNLITQSSNFSVWGTNPPINDIVAFNVATAPNGMAAACEARLSLYGGLARNASVTSGTTYTVSVWLKAKPGVTYASDAARVGFNQNTSTPYGATLNSTSGWFRATHTFTSNATQTNETWFGRGRGSGVSDVNFYAWGPQMEVGSTATSYIPTAASSVTRAADSASINGTGVITGTYTMVEKPAGCAVVNGTNIDLVSGYTAERVMVFPVALTGAQITAIRAVM